MSQKKKYLTSSELNQIELEFEKDKYRKLQEKEYDYQLKLKLMEIELLKKDTEILRYKKLNQVSLNQQERDKNKTFIEGLRKKYKLPEKWGFNPDSGEIKIEE